MSTTSRVSTCLWFNGRAEEAARLYVSLLPNSRITTITRHPAGALMPEGAEMTVELELDGVPFILLNGGPMFPQSESASISVLCDTQAEIDRLWGALTANGGKESQCGWLKDPYGVSWQIVPAQMSAWMREPQMQARVMAAFMPMRKLDLATLEAAAAGVKP